jgi:hypothetical protein
MLFTIQSSKDFIKPGTYPATFQGIETIETEKGNAYRWKFLTDSGTTISGLSDADAPPTVKNKTGRWLCGLAKQPLTAGVAIDPDNFVGKRYLCVLTDDGKGQGNGRLELFSPMDN